MNEILQMHSDRLMALDLVVRALMLTHQNPGVLTAQLSEGLDLFQSEHQVWDPESGVAQQAARVVALAREYLEDLSPSPLPRSTPG